MRLALFALATLLPACATTIVQKPAVENVHKIALVSLYAPATLRNEDGPSATEKASGWAATLGLSGNGKTADGAAGKSLVDFGGTRLVESGLAAFREELSHVKSWQVIDPASYVKNPAFAAWSAAAEKRTEKQMGPLGGMSRSGYVTPPGLPLVFFPGKLDDAEKKELAALAKAIGVDALAFVSLGMSYAPSTAIGGNGTARLHATGALNIVTKDGDLAVKSTGATFRSQSDDTVGMVAGSILFDDKTEAGLKQALTKTASMYRKEIVDEL